MRSSVVTGFGTRPRSCHERDRLLPVRWLDRPEALALLDGPAPDVDRGVEDRRLGITLRREIRNGLDRRIETLLGVGSDVLHRVEGGRDERSDGVALRLESGLPDDQPVAGERRDLVDMEHVDLLAGELELDGLVVGEARRGVDRALRHRGALPEVGVFDDLQVVRRQAR